MGTNYYAQLPGENRCEHCHRSDNAEELHIGKSSGGWVFALHVIPERGLNTLADWIALLATQDVTIRDEYGKKLDFPAMMAAIAQRGWNRPKDDKDSAWLQSNHAENGPNGLARSKIDGRHCVGHGEGTWDYIAGEFS